MRTMNEGKFPRGHAYIRMRNKGYRIDIDWPAVDSPEAEEMIKAVCEILKQHALAKKEGEPCEPAR